MKPCIVWQFVHYTAFAVGNMINQALTTPADGLQRRCAQPL
ncbi:hypothetical protein HMPREF9419_2022 [Prevotella nigrescens ATCC 33563]|nr:hypothetical protein HMPREF9419_2022 [Prevotella nigrescens ATCC 33563]